MESNLISRKLAPNPLMSLHASLLPIGWWGAAGCISQEGKYAHWASGVQNEPDYSSRGAISLHRLTQSHPLVKALSQKVANTGAKPAAPASFQHRCRCRSPGAGLWDALCHPLVGPEATEEPYLSSSYGLWTKPCGGQAPRGDPGHPWWGCPWQVGIQQSGSPSLGLQNVRYVWDSSFSSLKQPVWTTAKT